MQSTLKIKVKKNIIKELNQDLYRHLSIDLYDADHFFGYYNGYIYKLIDRVYDKYGAKGLRIEIKYIAQYLEFLFYKLKRNSTFENYELVVFYFRMYYKHFPYRKNILSNQLNFNF